MARIQHKEIGCSYRHQQCITPQCEGDPKLLRAEPAEETPISSVLAPYLSIGFQSSSFYLFGKVKNAPIRREISDEIDLPEGVTHVLSAISGDELQAVFRS
jgi:hypothetical protein